MASLSSIYIKKETLETILKTVNAKKEKGFEMTVSINDETNQWGQNVAAWASQSKEDRQAQKNKYYVGYGKCFWTNGEITTAEKQNIPEYNPPTAEPEQTGPVEDLPF